jgi:hypothetical protein
LIFDATWTDKPFYLPAYVSEQIFRFNTDAQRFDAMVAGIVGRSGSTVAWLLLGVLLSLILLALILHHLLVVTWLFY